MAARGFDDEFIVLRCVSAQTGSDCTRGLSMLSQSGRTRALGSLLSMERGRAAAERTHTAPVLRLEGLLLAGN